MTSSLYFGFESRVFARANLAFQDALIRFTRDVNLIHSPTQVLEEEGPITCAQVHFPWLSDFSGAFVRPLVQ